MQLSACLVISAYSTFLSMGLCFIGWLIVRYDLRVARIPSAEIEATAREAIKAFGPSALERVQDREVIAWQNRDFGAQSHWARIEHAIARAMRK
jgi:hypothetical protein